MHCHCLKFTVFLLLTALASSCSRPLPPDPLPGFPKLVLWAWERPENLSYITPQTGVAYLAGTMILKNGRARLHPRLQPLWMPPNTPRIAVVRIESNGAELPPNIIQPILDVVHATAAHALQIDFDARLSERRYYSDFMQQLRRALPAALPLEMTALVSWCQQDDWIAHLPVVEAVPMFFRMGVDPHTLSERVDEPLCAASLGVSTSELPATMPPGKRVFVFTEKPWTEATYRAVLRKLNR